MLALTHHLVCGLHFLPQEVVGFLVNAVHCSFAHAFPTVLFWLELVFAPTIYRTIKGDISISVNTFLTMVSALVLVSLNMYAILTGHSCVSPCELNALVRFRAFVYIVITITSVIMSHRIRMKRMIFQFIQDYSSVGSGSGSGSLSIVSVLIARPYPSSNSMTIYPVAGFGAS